MKVLYLHQYFSTPRGSSGTRSYEMARCLVDRGHQVLLVCANVARADSGLTGPFTRGYRRGFVDGIEVLEFDLAYSNQDGFIKRTVAFLRFAFRSTWVGLMEKCDLVFATSTPLTAGLPGIFARWLRGRPFVFEVRDLWPELPRAMGVIRNPLVLWAMSILEWVSYRSARRLIGLAPGILNGISRRGVDSSRLTLIPNGCDLALFSGGADLWRPDAVSQDDLLAVFAGAHGIANGLDAVLDAAILLKEQGRSDIKILLIGDGMLKPDLQRRAASEELTNVIFHEPVGKTRLAGLLAAADIGLQILDNVPAFYDGTSPNKLFDYLAAGLPPVINYPGWLAELVLEYECGYAVPPENPKAVAEVLIHAADHPESLSLMGARAGILARDRFDRKKLGGEFVDWLEAAVSQ